MGIVALVHMIGAFAILAFIIVQVYMTTTGHIIFVHTKAMTTGWEEIDEEVEIEDWERTRQQA